MQITDLVKSISQIFSSWIFSIGWSFPIYQANLRIYCYACRLGNRPWKGQTDRSPDAGSCADVRESDQEEPRSFDEARGYAEGNGHDARDVRRQARSVERWTYAYAAGPWPAIRSVCPPPGSWNVVMKIVDFPCPDVGVLFFQFFFSAVQFNVGHG